MKQVYWLVMAIVAITISMPAPASARARQAVEQEVLQADLDRFNAMVKADIAMLDRLLAAELTYIHSNARFEDKELFLFGIRTGSIKYLNVIPTERNARIIGNTAVINGVAAVRLVDRGVNLDITIRYTNVHVRRNGRWQMVAWQATRLQPGNVVIMGEPA
jgi:hypothetical protein